ncbi:asparagine synthase (glutamine-hydrolyzing) [Solidesulfovibrio sp.]
MCGIAGYIGSSPPTQSQIEACLQRMARRGPDARGVSRAEPSPGRSVCLLHTRLAIIDLDPRSNQPFDDGDLVIAFNGEVYNYLEVRRQLALGGEHFRTASDTEVLARVLTRQGPDGLDACEGMWAFAALDRRDGSVLLGRDRFGEKPLYLLDGGHGWYFGSEVKFLFALKGSAQPPNRRQVERFLVNGYKSLYKGSETFFAGVTELPAGTTLRLEPDRPPGPPRRYWTPAFHPEPDMGFTEAVDGARQALVRSMELRLRADVPLAFCMSGGVDSNSLIAVARRLFDYDVHGFTIVNTDARYEEDALVRLMVEQLGIRHTAIPIRHDGFLEGLRELVRQHDAPVLTITYYAHWLLMESVRRHGYRISLSGTAADELFTGYYDHHAFYLREVKSDPDLYARSLANWNRHIRPIVRNPMLQDPECFVKTPGCRGHIYLDADVFAARLHNPRVEAFSERQYCDDLLRNRMLNELFCEATPVILHEDDLNAMYHSIENRSPFLDRRLFDHCASIPTRHLVRDGKAKAVLREAMRGIVPDPVIDNRRKVGFNAPILDFLDVADPATRQELLRDSPIFDIVRRDWLEKALNQEGGLPNSESKFLFSLISAKMFLEEHGA